jgi:hypothetical protein
MSFESTEPHLGPSLLSIRLGTRHHPCRIVLVAATAPARGHTGIPSPGASRGTTTTGTATLLAAVVPGSVVPPLPTLAPAIVLGWLAVPLTVRICVSASTMSVSHVLQENDARVEAPSPVHGRPRPKDDVPLRRLCPESMHVRYGWF